MATRFRSTDRKGINNNVSIDGADNNNPFFGEQRGGQRPAFTVSLDAIKEFQVVADSAPAEFGRSSGGFINVVTKSGTNDVHGTLHEYQKWTGLTSRLSDGTRLSAIFAGAVRRHARRRDQEGQAVLLRRLRPAVLHPDQAEQSESHRPDAGQLSSPPSSAIRTRTARSRARTTPSRRWARSTGTPTARTCSRSATTSRAPGSPTARSTSSSGARSANAIERDFANTISAAVEHHAHGHAR